MLTHMKNCHGEEERLEMMEEDEDDDDGFCDPLGREFPRD